MFDTLSNKLSGVFDALRRGEAPDLLTLAQKSVAGSVSFRLPQGRDLSASRNLAMRSVKPGMARIDKSRLARDRMIKRHGDPLQRPWTYLIVATGHNYGTISHAPTSARPVAPMLSVLRSHGQYQPANMAE